MHWPWSRKYEEEEFYDEAPKPRQRETLRSAAEKVLIKELRRSGDIDLAGQIVNIRKPEPKTLAEQLNEMRTLQKLLKELGGGDKDRGWVKEVAAGLGEAIVPLLGQALSRQQEPHIQIQQPQYQRLPQPRPVQPQPQPTVQPTAQAKEPEGVQLQQLCEVLEMEPNEACDTLAKMDRNWLLLLSEVNYELLLIQIHPLAMNNPELKPIVEKLNAEGGESWLNEIIVAARSALNTKTM